MASISPQGERAVLAMLADQYVQIVNLRERLLQVQEELNRANAQLDERAAEDREKYEEKVNL